MGETTADELTFKCEDLVLKKRYKFRVKAINQQGESEPGFARGEILAKDPWGESAGRSIASNTDV